ncbi:MAG: heme o synthase [Acidilobaceae archaeon]|nr:heme o synthase [Acidilobaceae archaeon]
MEPLGKLADILELTKPRQTALLLLTMFSAYFVAGGPLDPVLLAKMAIMGFAAVGGVTALNMYLDADIDAIMRRTSKRPLPAGRISAAEVSFITSLMILVGAFVASTINNYVLFTVLAGLYFDIVGYTELTKRYTPFSIVFGSIAGVMPALGGWAAGAGAITLPGLLLAGVIYAWQPLHVWFLAYAAEEDYRKAGVPVASLQYSPKVFSSLVIAHLLIMAFSVWGLAYLLGFGIITAALSTVFIALAVTRVASFYRSPSKEEAFKIFKFATPTLAIVYLLLPSERYLLYLL